MSGTGHLVHGMGTGLEAPAWPAITNPQAAAMLAQLPAAGRLETISWHSPRPFSSAGLVQTDRGPLFLKRHHRRLRSPAGLTAEHAFIAHLRECGVPVAEVLADAAGRTALADGEWLWEAHRQAEGADLYRERQSWTPYLSAAHAHAAGAALAGLHNAAEGFAAPTRPAEPLIASLTILTAANPLRAAEAYVAARPALGHYLHSKDWQAQLAGMFARWDAAGLAAALRRCAPMWTHNDWHPSNLLWAADGTVASVLDFGLADRTCALHDLALALERCAVRWLEIGTTRDLAAIGDAQALLAGYATKRALPAADRGVLACLLPLVHLEFALSEVDYFAGVLGRPADADLAWHGYLIGHADWFAGADGQALLSAVRG